MSAIHWTYAEYLEYGGIPAGQTIIIMESSSVLGALDPTDLAAMAAAGISGIDAADDALVLTVAQLTALGSLSLAGNDRVLIGDDPSIISSLTVAEIGAMVVAGVDGIEATHGDLTLSLSQVQALAGMALVMGSDQWSSGSTALAGVAGGYRLEVAGVAVSDAVNVQADPAVAGFLVVGGTEDVAAALAALSAATKLLRITLTDGTNLALSHTSYVSSERVLSLLSGTHTLTVSSVPAASVAGLETASGVVAFSVRDTASAVAAALHLLNASAKLAGIDLIDEQPLQINYAKFATDTTALGLLPHNYALSVGGVSAVAAAELEANDHVVDFQVSDSAANITGAIDGLRTYSKLSSISLIGAQTLVLSQPQWAANNTLLGLVASGTTLTVTGVTADQAVAVQADSQVNSFEFRDSSDNFLAAIEALHGTGKLTAISLTDDAVLNLSFDQFGAAAALLDLLPGGRSVIIGGVPVAGAASVQASIAVTAFTVLDSASNIAQSLELLNGVGKLAGISLTDSDPLAISYGQMSGNALALAALPDGCNLVLHDVPAAAAALVQANVQVAAFSVRDSAGSISAALHTLKGATKLTGIELADTSLLVVTYTRFHDDGAAFVLLPDEATLVVTGVPVDAASTVEAHERVVGFVVSDSAAHVAAALDTLGNYTKLTGIGLVEGAELSISFAQFIGADSVMGYLSDSIRISVAKVAVDHISHVQDHAWVTTFSLHDTPENIVSSLEILKNSGKLSSISVENSDVLAVSSRQFFNYSTVFGLLSSDIGLMIDEVLVVDVASVQGNARVVGFEVSDSAVNITAALGALNGASKILGIHLLDGAILPLDHLNWVNNTRALGLLQDEVRLMVSGVSAHDAALIESEDAVAVFSVHDTADNIALSLSNLNGLAKLVGISLSDARPLVLGPQQILAATHALSLFSDVPQLVMRADAVALGLAAEQISEMSDHGVGRMIASAGGLLTLNVRQYLALTSIILDPDDTVILADMGDNLATLTVGQLTGLSSAGIDRINATDDILRLTVEQLLSLGAVLLAPADTIALADSGVNISGLTEDQIFSLARTGIDTIDATDDQLRMTLAQFRSLGGVALTAADLVSIGDSAMNVQNIDLSLLGGIDFVVIGESPGGQNIFGSFGNDVYFVDSQLDVIYERSTGGIDTVITGVSFYFYPNLENLILAVGAGGIFGVGNDGANTITGNEGDNLIIALAGDDDVYGDSGNDIIYGGSGNDTILGAAGIDYLFGGEDDDVIDGGLDADLIYGEGGDDSLTGGSDFVFDMLVGGEGNDTLNGASGFGDFDYLYGGPGDDVYFVDTPADLVFEFAGEGNDIVYANIKGAGYYLYGEIEDLVLLGTTPFGVGNTLDNRLTGNDAGNYLLGGAGNDSINGKGGNDVLFGEVGADTFIFERGTGGDVIGDFLSGTDKIQLIGLGFINFNQVQLALSVVGMSSAINLGQGDFIVILGTVAFVADDFLFS
jgi:Ca2+-binding RTX toxin-like protein